jgi:cardiolipin synthase
LFVSFTHFHGNMIYIPNLLTFARIGLVPLLLVLLQEQKFSLSLAVFIVAGLTDALDGFIAKRFNAQTRLGAILDPLADKALLVSSYVMLSIMGIIPFWLMVVVVFRDIVIVIGYLIMVLFFGKVEMQPLRISKINTVLQIGFIIVVLSALSGVTQINVVIPSLEFAVLASSIVSGATYVYIWSIKATQDSSKLYE